MDQTSVQDALTQSEHSEQSTPVPQPHHEQSAQELRAEYRRLLDKKFAQGLSSGDRTQLNVIEAALDAAEMSSPVEVAAQTADQARHVRIMASLKAVLHELEAISQ